MIRRVIVVVLVVIAAAVVYRFAFGDKRVSPQLTLSQATSTIGSGSDAVGVGPDGSILGWLPAPEEGTLPSLPLSDVPKGGRLAGPMLQQARVLGAAPAVLRPCIARSYFGESGVDVVLGSGIELRFGDASRAAEKWASAATVLADPSITALDYVDLHSPRHPAIYGSSHTLPAAEGASGGSCGE